MISDNENYLKVSYDSKLICIIDIKNWRDKIVPGSTPCMCENKTVQDVK